MMSSYMHVHVHVHVVILTKYYIYRYMYMCMYSDIYQYKRTYLCIVMIKFVVGLVCNRHPKRIIESVGKLCIYM